MHKINGKNIAEKILNTIQVELKNKPAPKLAIVIVGDDEASKVYVERKRLACQTVGIEVQIVNLSDLVELNEFKNIFADVIEKVDGVILQLPLPEKLREYTDELLAIIPVEKDVDCLRLETLQASCANKINWLPPIVEAVEQIVLEVGINLAEKKICLVGKGKVTGLPLYEIYKARNYDVTVVDEHTENISLAIKQADVVISATGVAHLITSEMIKDNALVIDAGFSRKDGKIVGDVDGLGLENRQIYLSPSPGGIGPITVACLLLNVVKSSKEVG